VNQSVADNSELGKDAFLQILVTELANQDPLEPLDSTEYISQLAQFSEVEQVGNVSDTLESLVSYVQFSAASMVGNNVTYADESGVNVSATVDSVVFEQGQVLVGMDNGDQVSFDRIVSVK
jgi:flagellar basal-body rod modification protein FlgD